MVNKKSWLKLSLASIATTVLLPIISAQYFWEVNQGVTDAVQILKDFLGPLFETILGVSQFDQYFYARLLFLVIIYVMTYLAIGNIELFKDKKFIMFVIAASVSILGARYIGDLRVIEAMLLPYGAIAIAISVILPVVIFGFFVHKTIPSGLGRRAAWIFFGVIFIGLWWTRPQVTEFRWIYNVGILAVIALVAFDKQLHVYFGLYEGAETRRKILEHQIASIDTDIDKLSSNANPSPTVEKVIERLKKRRDELSKKL